MAGIILYRRQAREKDRVQKDMQNKMDMLEAKVAKECKEGETETWLCVYNSLLDSFCMLNMFAYLFSVR